MSILIFGLLCGCAPAGYFYETGSFVARPRDACAVPETATEFVVALNRKVGQRDGPRDRVASVQGLGAAGQVIESRYQFTSCRGTLVFTTGQTDKGTISIVDREGPRILQASWDSDEVGRKHQAEQQALIAEAQRNSRIQRAAEEGSAPIEKDAVMFEDSRAWLEQTEKLVRLIRANGFTCETVSAARPMLTARGYVLVCNKFSYTYDIQDKGGNWLVSVR
jgi:hypothetical protein